MGKTYVTAQGDLWDSIAYTQLGSMDMVDRLMKMNPAYLEIYIFPAGVVLQLPEPEEPVNDSLPPWKQAK